MDKFVVTHVDTYVAEGLSHGVEEHQVAGLQIFFVYFFSGVCLFTRTAGQHFAQSFLVHGSDKTAAIKAVIVGATATVRYA